MNRIFVTRLFGMIWLGGGGILVCERHVISSVLCSVITLEVTEVVSLSSSFEPFLNYVIQYVAMLRTIYQRPYHNKCSHIQSYQAQLTRNLVSTVTTCNGIQQCSCKNFVFSDIHNFCSLQFDVRRFLFIDFYFSYQNELNALETDHLFIFYSKFHPYESVIISQVYNKMNGTLGSGVNISFRVKI